MLAVSTVAMADMHVVFTVVTQLARQLSTLFFTSLRGLWPMVIALGCRLRRLLL